MYLALLDGLAPDLSALMFFLLSLSALALNGPALQVDDWERQLQPLLNFVKENPLFAVLGVVVFLFLVSKLPASRHGSRRYSRRYRGSRDLPYYAGRALGDVLFRRNRRR